MEPTEEAGVEQSNSEKPGLGPLVQIDEGRIQSHLGEVVRTTVEETLNGKPPSKYILFASVG